MKKTPNLPDTDEMESALLANIRALIESARNTVGHDIPEATIRRRFDAGKRLFVEVYQPLVDQWILYDNAGDEPQLISWSDQP
jgi:predicted ABC-type ATPase